MLLKCLTFLSGAFLFNQLIDYFMRYMLINRSIINIIINYMFTILFILQFIFHIFDLYKYIINF